MAPLAFKKDNPLFLLSLESVAVSPPLPMGPFSRGVKKSPSVLPGRDDKQTSRGTNKDVWHYSISRKKKSAAISVFLVLDIFFSENGER